MTLVVPLLGSALGIDGGAIFQLLASQDLARSPAAIGLAVGLGVVSLPFQLLAARMPLRLARRNLRLYLLLAALQTALLATLVASRARGPAATVGLGVAVGAEISLSVLYATSWQPLLSCLLGPLDRQRLNGPGRAAAGALLALAVALFGALPREGRATFLAVLATAALVLARRLAALPDPSGPPAASGADNGADPTAAGAAAVASANEIETGADTGHGVGTRLLLAALALVNLGAWPLILVYVQRVLWPAAALGLLGAVQVAGSLVAGLSWRASDPAAANRLGGRARLAAAGLVGSALVLALLRAPLGNALAQLALLGALGSAALSASTIRLAVLELTHRRVSAQDSVRTFTLLDVVGSTSLQVGLLLGGLAIEARPAAYRWFVLSMAVAGALAVHCLMPRSRRNSPRQQPAAR